MYVYVQFSIFLKKPKIEKKIEFNQLCVCRKIIRLCVGFLNIEISYYLRPKNKIVVLF